MCVSREPERAYGVSTGQFLSWIKFGCLRWFEQVRVCLHSICVSREPERAYGASMRCEPGEFLSSINCFYVIWFLQGQVNYRSIYINVESMCVSREQGHAV